LCCGTRVVGYPPTLAELGAELGEIGLAFGTASKGPKKLFAAL
jgi:hypothetical protein